MKAHYNDYITIGPAIGGIQNKKKTFFFWFDHFSEARAEVGEIFCVLGAMEEKESFRDFLTFINVRVEGIVVIS